MEIRQHIARRIIILQQYTSENDEERRADVDILFICFAFYKIKLE